MSNEPSEKSIFHSARLIHDEVERAAYLQRVCRDEHAIQQLQALLRAHETDSGLLECNAPSEDLESHTESRIVGTVVDRRYKVLEKIGEGGFGAVYMADQLLPVQRRVALKIIKPGMDSRQVIARFEVERQALALMDHPGIAKVLDAGKTERGSPYFVMELVRGIPITDYCDAHNLSTRQRLRLFVEVCSAIQHAHQKGIIHRDIKPNNILVTTNGDESIPKVIDFGIAKATQGRLTDKTLFTQFRQFLGTPAYMSPEQAQMSAVDVDTRTDVYSLGALLYELITGDTPINSRDIEGAGLEEVLRRIRDVEAPKPSLRISSLTLAELSTVAKNRATAPSRFSAEIRGDLDWVVMKAVEKERSRRYPTAESLGLDVRRHLNGEAVSAVPPTTRYLLRKFARRNRRLLATATCFAAVLLAATLLSTSLAIRLFRAVGEKETALSAETAARTAAENERLRAQRQAYIFKLNTATMAYQLGDLAVCRAQLEDCRNIESQDELRGWEWRALWQQSGGNVKLRFGTQAPVWSLCVVPDRPLIVANLAGGSVAIWNYRTGELYRTLVERDADANILGLKEGRKYQRIYGITKEGEVWQWELPDFKRVRFPLKLVDPVEPTDGRDRFAMSPDEALLAVSRHNRVVIFERSHGRWLEAESIETSSSPSNVEFSPLGRFLVVGAAEVTRILQTENWKEIAVLRRGGNYAMAFSPDGELLATSPRFNNPHIYLYRTDNWEYVGKLVGNEAVSLDLEFSPDGRYLASASSNIRIWDVQEQVEVSRLLGHRSGVESIKYANDGTLLGGGRGDICVFDLDAMDPNGPITKRTMPKGWDRRYSQASFSHDGEWIASCALRENQRVVVTLRSADSLEEISELEAAGTNVRGVRFSPVELTLITGDRNGCLATIDASNGQLKARHRVADCGQVAPVAFSQDGSRVLVVVQQEGQASYVLWSIRKSSVLSSWTVKGVDKCASISPDGKTVVTGRGRRFMSWWNAETGEQVGSTPLVAKLWHVAFSPSGDFVVAAGASRIELVDVRSRRVVGSFSQTTKTNVHSMCFSSDGTRLAVGGGGSRNALKVFDVATRRELVTLPTEGYSFRQVEFSPDDEAVLLIGGAMGPADSIKLWRPPTLPPIDGESSR